jgi:hypothetical protein
LIPSESLSKKRSPPQRRHPFSLITFIAFSSFLSYLPMILTGVFAAAYTLITFEYIALVSFIVGKQRHKNITNYILTITISSHSLQKSANNVYIDIHMTDRLEFFHSERFGGCNDRKI